MMSETSDRIPRAGAIVPSACAIACAFAWACHESPNSGTAGLANQTSAATTFTSVAAGCSGSVRSNAPPAGSLPHAPSALTVPAGFSIEAIGAVAQARELVALPNGDLLVGTNGNAVYVIPNADADAPGAPTVFATVTDSPAQGVAFDPETCTVYVSAQHGAYAIAYADGLLAAAPGSAIATFRSGPVAPGSDGDVHTTSSIAVAGGALYFGVGSSCNTCVETDPTRATIQRADLDGRNMTTAAKRIRNPIALTANPATGTLWAGGAGQDDLTAGHPYEYFDAVTLHVGVPDYGWPDCEENRVPYTAGVNCGSIVEPLVELPAYSTIIGAAFYPETSTGAHAFPATYRGGVFVTAHGSWHQTRTNGAFAAAPRVVFVPMNGDAPAAAVVWSDPTKQWSDFVGGFQSANGKTRSARPTGVAVGTDGSLFVADDQNGLVYRIRPN